MASHTSCPAGCCVPSPYASASYLPEAPPLIAPLSLVVPWPPLSLVWLVVVLPPPLIFLAYPCLSARNLHLPPPICLSLFAPAGCHVTSHCAAFATYPLDTQPPLNALADCSDASCCSASAACPLGALLPLNVPPPPPTPICLLFALAGCCVTYCCTALLIISMRCRLSTHRLVVALPLVAQSLQLILLMCCRLSAFQLVVASPLIVLPPPLILSARPCLSMCCLHLTLSICLLFAPAGYHILSNPCCFADMGARAKRSTLHLPVPLVNKYLTFQPTNATAPMVD